MEVIKFKKHLFNLGKVIKTRVEYDFDDVLSINNDKAIRLPNIILENPLHIPKKVSQFMWRRCLLEFYQEMKRNCLTNFTMKKMVI